MEFQGMREVQVLPSACGQVRMVPGDEATFSVPEVGSAIVPSGEGVPPGLQAMMVALTRTSRLSGSAKSVEVEAAFRISMLLYKIVFSPEHSL